MIDGCPDPDDDGCGTCKYALAGDEWVIMEEDCTAPCVCVAPTGGGGGVKMGPSLTCNAAGGDYDVDISNPPWRLITCTTFCESTVTTSPPDPDVASCCVESGQGKQCYDLSNCGCTDIQEWCNKVRRHNSTLTVTDSTHSCSSRNNTCKDDPDDNNTTTTTQRPPTTCKPGTVNYSGLVCPKSHDGTVQCGAHRTSSFNCIMSPCCLDLSEFEPGPCAPC